MICFINLDEKQSKGTRRLDYTSLYFDVFGTEYIPQDIFRKIKHKSNPHNTIP